MADHKAFWAAAEIPGLPPGLQDSENIQPLPYKEVKKYSLILIFIKK